MKKTLISIALVSILSACGGGSDSPTTQASITIDKDISFQPILTGNFSFDEFFKLTQDQTAGFFPPWVGDLNNDGYDDVVLPAVVWKNNTVKKFPSGGMVQPLVFIYNKDRNQFESSQEFRNLIGALQFPRQGQILDINGDGKNDLFIADHGYDESAYGAPNQLIMSIGDTKRNVSRSGELSTFRDFSHGLIKGDFNNDGIMDLLVLNNMQGSHMADSSRCLDDPSLDSSFCPYQNLPINSASYFLLGNKNSIPSLVYATTKDDTNSILQGTVGNNLRLTEGAIGRFNIDTYPDLVLGTLGEIRILESYGPLEYSTVAKFLPPSKLNCSPGFETPYGMTRTIDLDNDGIDEIITQIRCTSNEQYIFQVLGKKNNKWLDLTDTYFPNQELSKEWAHTWYLVDINKDGKLDILKSWDSSNVYLNENNVFVSRRYEPLGLEKSFPVGVAPIKLGKEQYFVGIVNRENSISLYTWR